MSDLPPPKAHPMFSLLASYSVLFAKHRQERNRSDPPRSLPTHSQKTVYEELTLGFLTEARTSFEGVVPYFSNLFQLLFEVFQVRQAHRRTQYPPVIPVLVHDVCV